MISAAGTGNPYFSTDTAAASRALEMTAAILLPARKRGEGDHYVGTLIS